MIEYPGLVLVDHPLAKHKLGLMRDKSCDDHQFRRLMKQVGLLMAAEVTKDLPLEPRKIETSFATCVGERLDQEKIAIIPVLRAGLVFGEAFHELMPVAKTGHLGLFRDHEKDSVARYLVSLPSGEFRRFYLLDPIIATGSTIFSATEILLELGVPTDRIRVVSLIVAEDGLEKIYSDPRFSGLRIYAVARDLGINDEGYIVPGLGRAGDRLFGTGAAT